MDYKGRGEGELTIALLPCDNDGVPFEPDSMHVENPGEKERERERRRARRQQKGERG